MTVRQTIAIRRKLLRWYDDNRRQLPWRKNRDPYRVWISEIMLQQTRVQAVIPYYERFLRRFPNVAALSTADEQELLAYWSGLGYYSRARNLQKAAQVIVNRHSGLFPRELEATLALPGIGAYTAAAILSIAYDAPLAVLDGNVARVLSRLFALTADLRATKGKQKLLRQAEILLSAKRPGDFNQALMELGATVCLPQQPQCPACPIRKACRALAANAVEKYPPSRRKQKPVSRRFVAALITDGEGKCLLIRRPPSAQWMKGFWELPMREETSRGSASMESGSQNGIVLGPLLGHVRHTITTNRLDVAVFVASLDRAAIPSMEQWVSPGQIQRLPVTTITRKALRLADRAAVGQLPLTYHCSD